LAMSGRVLLRASSFDSHTMHYPLLGGDGRISKDRRRFVVLSFFDFMLVMLLWFICTVSSGMDIGDAFIKEIDIFKETFMKESLFDVVLIVALRMIVLMVCYGALRFTTWVPVAVTTGFSSAYLLIKVIFFFSHKSSVTLPQYLIVLASFIVAWVELWFMPFRVLPRERHAQELAEVTSVTSSRPASITRPVIPFSDDEFRSALEFSSSEEEENASTSTVAANKGKKGSKASYIKAACTAQERTTRMLSTAVTWRALRPHDPVVRQSDSGAFYVRSTFPVTAKELWEAVWVRNLEWNDQVLDAKEVLKVDERTCLFYSVSAPAMRGYIASRDFLDVRRVDAEPELGEYSGYFMSVDSHLLPPNTNKKIVRGTNGPSVMRVYAAGDDGASSTLEWIMQTDLKGGLPKRVVQANMLTFFVNNMTRLRAYLARPH
ncbi:tag-340, partial [Pristionchus pacificus]